MARSQANGKGKQRVREDELDEDMGEIEWSQTQKRTQTQKGKGKSTQAAATQNRGDDNDRHFLTYDPDMPEAMKREVRVEYRQLMEATAGECRSGGCVRSVAWLIGLPCRERTGCEAYRYG
jgi:hypothetical protein